jgi:membrane protein YdbS with pleckstrin-like domain
MKALGFTPDRNYLFKRFAQLVLIAFIVVSVTVIAGLQIGHWINPSEGRTWGLITCLSLNLAWLGLTIYLIYQHFRSLFYEIHDDEVIMHAGVITRSVTHVPFQMITNLKVRRSPLDRLFKLGTIDIQTAGKGEHHGVTESLVGLRNFKDVYDHVTASMRQNRDLSFGLQDRKKVCSSELEMLRTLLQELKNIRMLLQDHGMHQKHLG